MLTLLYNLTQFTEENPNNAINTFCFHAPRDVGYPHRIPNLLEICANRFLEVLLSHASRFYYNYVWARNRMDICRQVTLR